MGRTSPVGRLAERGERRAVGADHPDLAAERRRRAGVTSAWARASPAGRARRSARVDRGVVEALLLLVGQDGLEAAADDAIDDDADEQQDRRRPTTPRSSPSRQASDRCGLATPAPSPARLARSGRIGHGVPRGDEAVAGLRDRLDQPRVRGVVAELAPQVRDVDVDDPVVDLVRPAGHRLEQLVAGEDRAGASGERGQQPDLAGRQAAVGRASPRRPTSVKRRLAGSTTSRPPSNDSGGSSVGAIAAACPAPRTGRAAAAQDRRDPGGQLVRVERLGEVVVGAHPQAGDPLDVAALGRGDQDRRVAALADRREDRLAVEPGQHQVEDDEVDRLGVEGRDRGTAVADDRDGVPVALEIEPQELAEAWFVLDDQDPGAARPWAHPSRAPIKET